MTVLAFFTIVALAAVVFVIAVVALWRHQVLVACTCISLFLLGAGTLLNITGLRHVDFSGVRYSWAMLPDVAYTAAVMLPAMNLALCGVAKLVQMQRTQRNKRAPEAVTGSQQPVQEKSTVTT